MRIRTLAALAAAILFAAPAAQAQTNLSQSFTLSTGHPLVSFSFDVTSAGTFQLFTQAPTIDPEIYLFSGTDISASGSFLADDDDGCPNALCGASGSWYNGLITISLGTGTYTVVGTQCCTSSSAVQSGTVGFGGSDAPITLVVRSEQGIATSATSTVPEPSTYVLMGSGLLGLAGVAHRRRKA